MNGIEPGSVLAELEDQPADVRRLFIYAVCQTMVEAGLLEFVSASTVEGVGTVLVYRNPDSDQMFEIAKPDIEADDEQQMREHIRQLLEKQG